MSGPWPWLGLQSGFDALFPKGGLYYWKSRALAELTDEALDDIAGFAGAPPSPQTDVVIWHHGGAMSRVGEADTAYAGRDAAYLVTGRGHLDRSRAERRGARVGARGSGPRSTATRRAVSTSTSPASERSSEALVRAGYGANYDRLAELKRTYDPGNLFRMNLNIAPAE